MLMWKTGLSCCGGFVQIVGLVYILAVAFVYIEFSIGFLQCCPGSVISSVFKSVKSFYEDIGSRIVTDITDYSTYFLIN